MWWLWLFFLHKYICFHMFSVLYVHARIFWHTSPAPGVEVPFVGRSFPAPWRVVGVGWLVGGLGLVPHSLPQFFEKSIIKPGPKCRERLALGDPSQLKSHVTVTYPGFQTSQGVVLRWEKFREINLPHYIFMRWIVKKWRKGSSFGFLGGLKTCIPSGWDQLPCPGCWKFTAKAKVMTFCFLPQFCWGILKKTWK